MGLEDSIKKLKFDNRMVDWNLRHGVLTKEEIQSHLNGLEDCSANAVKLNLGDSSSTSSLDREPAAQPQQPENPAQQQVGFNNAPQSGNPYGGGSSDSGFGGGSYS